MLCFSVLNVADRGCESAGRSTNDFVAWNWSSLRLDSSRFNAGRLTNHWSSVFFFKLVIGSILGLDLDLRRFEMRWSAPCCVSLFTWITVLNSFPSRFSSQGEHDLFIYSLLTVQIQFTRETRRGENKNYSIGVNTKAEEKQQHTGKPR